MVPTGIFGPIYGTEQYFDSGESEYEVSFGLPILKHRNLLPGRERGTEFKFELPAKFAVGRAKLGVPGHTNPEIKGQWLNWIFFLKMAKLDFFLDLSFCVFAEIMLNYYFLGIFTEVHMNASCILLQFHLEKVPS